MGDNVKKIDKYEIIEEIGRGGMAIVYKGLHPFLEEYVAIKVLPEYFVQDREFVERFTREAKTMIALQHPHIVRIYDAGIYENKYFIVMDYIRGRTIKELISDNKGKLLDVDRVIDIVMQVADALSYAHKHNIIHRDVKPSNILYDESKQSAYITDFGIAKAVSGTKLTQTGVSLGTPEYMSPEQFSETSDVDQRTDIYSLGIVFYEMLTGDIPFKGDTPLGVAYKHVHTYPTRPRIKNPKISVYLEKVILKMLAKDPNDRYQSMDELIRDLKLFKDKDYEHMIASSYVEEKKCKLAVTSDPEGAKVYLDGEYIGLTPLKDAEVSYGEHKVLLILLGYKDATDEIEIPLTKKTYEKSYTLQPEPGYEKEEAGGKTLSEEKTVAIPAKEARKETLPSEHIEETTPSEGKTVKVRKEPELAESSRTESPTIAGGPQEGSKTYPPEEKGYLDEYIGKIKILFLKPFVLIPAIILLLSLAFIILRGRNQNITTNTNNATSQLAYLSISSEPRGAEVYIDGVKVGITPLNKFSTKPGTHTIKLAKEGYLESDATIDIKEKESKTLSYTLKEKTSTTTAEKDIPVSISSNPAGAKVYIDGKEIGTTPIANYSMKAGTYTLKLIKDGYKEFSQNLTLNSSDTSKTVNIPLEKSSTTSTSTSSSTTTTPKTGTLSVNSNPTGAKVYINNIYSGITPLTLTLNTGTYTVKITKNGYLDYSETVNIRKNERYSINQPLIKLGKTATVNISTNPTYATVYIDGVKVGLSPLFFYKIEPGYHEIRVTKEGYLEYYGEFTIKDGETKTLPLISLAKLP